MVDLTARYGIDFDGTHPIRGWCMRHASWVISRYHVRGSGQTPHFLAYEHNYNSEILSFGETIIARFPRPKHRLVRGSILYKGQPGFARVIWVGRRKLTQEHVGVNAYGCIMARTVRRLEEGPRTDVALMSDLRATPWDPKGGRERMPRAPVVIATPAALALPSEVVDLELPMTELRLIVINLYHFCFDDMIEIFVSSSWIQMDNFVDNGYHNYVRLVCMLGVVR